MKKASSMNIENTLKFIKLAHKDQKYGEDIDYWNHCVEVADNVIDSTEEEYIAALLHDVVEDTEYTFNDLLELGYSEYVVDIVKLLTKVEGTYIDNILKIVQSNNLSAIKIKISDNEVNLKNLVSLKSKKRVDKLNKKYLESILILREAFHAISEELQSNS